MPQQEIWREHALFPGTAVHTVSAQSTITGPLDANRLERAIGWVWDRHEALRLTPFATADGAEPILIAADRPECLLALHDVCQEPAPAAAAEALAAELGRRAIPLDGGPTCRFDLIAFGAEQHIWVMSYHHINMDAWANGILVRDTAAAYSAFTRGEDPALADAPLFADAVEADRAFQETARFQKNCAYWKALYQTMPDRLVDAVPSILEGRPPANTTLCRLAIDGATMDRLRQVAQDRNTTPARLFIAGALILLHRQSGARDVVFGMPVLNRPTAKLKATFGLFSMTTAPRVEIDPTAGLDDLLAKLDASMRNAMRHHRFPLSNVNRELGLAAKQVLQLFDLNISYERVDFGELPFGDAVAAVPRVLLNNVERTPVEIFVRDYGDANRIEVDLDLSLGAYTEEEAQALSSRYLRVLEWLSCGGVGGFGAVPLVAPSERAWLLDEVNDRARDYGPFVPVHGAFEALARAEPERPAVRFEGMEIGYGELNTRANGLAHRLRRAGVGRDVRVGVALERSVELVVALLAVVKAGGAYVPLDPELPADRLSFMISDADAAVVVTRTGLLETLPLHDGRTICIDDGARSGRRGLASDDLEIALEPDDLAYVIYTSGSTGRPKGVMNSHGGLRNRLMWMQDAFPIGAEDRVLQKTPYTFDVSVWEFFWPLMRGATIVVAKPEGHRDPDYLAGLLHDEGVTVLHFVPSMLQAFLGHEPSAALLGDCWALRYVICSGEALSPGLADRFHGFAPDGASLHNLYGPTEAAIDVTHWPCCDPSADPLPIGHGIANTRLYVLDSAHEPVPVGVAGDLWIGGVQVARGYVRRPGLTAESFIADPHGPVPGGRMYRTGDLARRRADGALEYLGRRDFQVKLRGFRIELGEIESVLLNHGGIRSGAVLLREDRAGDPRLVGYIVPEGGVLPGDLEAYLRDRLADYMVPSDWVVLDALPVTANGKLDRGALPAPDLRTGVGSGRPRGPEEEVCCAVFASVLGRENVGVEDNFFALGGHSLLAVQVVGRLRRALQVELPANAVFAHASPRLLAAHIQNARHLKTTPINKRKPEDVVLPSMGQDLIWFLSNLEGSNAYNVPDGFIVDGPLDVEALSAALSDVVGRHEALRATLPEEDGRPIVRIQPPGPISVDVEHLSTTEDAGIRAWFTKQGLRSFDIEREIPVRAVVGALPDGRHLLSLVMHHSATDGGSAAVIYGDLTTAYHARRRGRALALPPLAIEYYDWAAWQREHLQSSETETALNAVVERLRGAPEILDLPVEFERADPSSFSGSMLHLPLPRSLERNLRASARDKQATLFMLLLAGLGVTLQRLSGQTDIVIGAPAAGRTRAEVQDTVGYFVNTVPLRLALDGAENLDEVVEIARQEVLEGFAHQELSLDRIVSALNLDRAGVRTPLFRVLLVLQPADRMTLELDDATVTPVHVDAVSARYDLTFAFEDYGDGLELVLHYANDLFSEATARRFARYFEVVLDAIASSPSTPADQVLLFGPGSSEYSDEVSGSAVVDDRGAPSGTILDRFSEIAARHGDLVALEGPDGGGLDYGALDRLTDRLADALAAAGVGRGDLVGVNMARGVEQIVLFLSILKAGGAYVPLDREQPGPRLAGMVADGGIGFVVRDDAPTGGEWLGEDIKVLSYGALAASDQQDAVWDTARNGADTAYVMFTSGSSGRPKGVQVPHRAVLRLAVEPGFASFGPGKRVAQIATTSFDAATYEIWCALLNGGTCVVVEREAAYDGASLASAFQGASGRVGVHSTFLTVSVFNRAVYAAADAFSGFEEVMFGGEAADAAAVRAAVARWPDVRFINGYGPTETTTFAAHHGVVELLPTAARVPIGHPIRGTALYILDRHLSPVPRGVAGELWIGGIGLADGYVGRPGQTASVFAADPFSPEPGSRMYRSGDLARRRPDGAVDYLGRVDRQLKLRGFRIEPGEVEAALRAVAGVDQVHVAARTTPLPGGGEDRALYAWVAMPEGKNAPDDDVIRGWRTALMERLPEWLTPRRIGVVEAFPLTPNGKLDQAALMTPLGDDPLDGTTAVDIVYGTETERQLAAIWSELLGGGVHGPEDGFFASGGHSLLGVRLLALIRQRFKVAIPLRQIFEKPILSQMAKAIEAASGGHSAEENEVATIKRRARRSDSSGMERP